MNITDIDDKIIKRARQNHLFEQYASAGYEIEKVLADAKPVLQVFAKKVQECQDADKKTMLTCMLTKAEVSIAALEKIVAAHDEVKIREQVKLFLNDIRDPLADWLDDRQGKTVTEHSIFSQLARQWEDAYHNDMEALNVRDLGQGRRQRMTQEG